MLISIRIFHSNFQRTQKVQPKSQGRGHKKSNPKWGAYFVRLSHVCFHCRHRFIQTRFIHFHVDL